LAAYVIPKISSAKNKNRGNRGPRRTPRRRPVNNRPIDKLNAPNMLIPRPPQIPSYNIMHSVVLRFIVNTAVNQDITVENLCDTILFAASATVGYDVFAFVKIRRINMWCIGTLGSSEFLTLQYNAISGTSLGDNKIHTATSMGIEPACISAKPSVKSLISNFQAAGSGDVAFNIDAPSGTVIDCHLTFMNEYSGSPTQAGSVLVGATVGATYLRGLDGLPAATTKFTPVLGQDFI